MEELSRRGYHFLPTATGIWVKYGVELLGLVVSVSTMYSRAFEWVGYMSFSRNDDMDEEALSLLLQYLSEHERVVLV